MFSLFHSLMDTFKEIQKQNRALQMNMRRKQKNDSCGMKEKKAIVRETLKPFFGQEQIDMFLQHQTKRVRDWSKDAIFQAETLRRCISRCSYRRLRESKLFPLPSLTALKIHLEKYGGMPDIPGMPLPVNRLETKFTNNEDVDKSENLEKVPPLEPSKKKGRKRAIKEVDNSTNEAILEQPAHIEIPAVDPMISNTSDGIMMLPVVQSAHLPCSQHEVVLAVNSIVP